MIKALKLLPGEKPKEVEIGTDLASLQAEVEGLIEFTYPFDDNAIVIGNEEAKLINMKGNRRINGSVYAGPLLIVGDDGCGDLKSLTTEQLQKYAKMFETPEDISDEEVANDMFVRFIAW